jgi:hypothetical protein
MPVQNGQRWWIGDRGACGVEFDAEGNVRRSIATREFSCAASVRRRSAAASPRRRVSPPPCPSAAAPHRRCASPPPRLSAAASLRRRVPSPPRHSAAASLRRRVPLAAALPTDQAARRLVRLPPFRRRSKHGTFMTATTCSLQSFATSSSCAAAGSDDIALCGSGTDPTATCGRRGRTGRRWHCQAFTPRIPWRLNLEGFTVLNRPRTFSAIPPRHGSC